MFGETYKVVSGDEPIIVNYPDKAMTFGIGPCIAIGILNRKISRGYLGHYIPLVKSSESMVGRAIDEAINPNDLEASLAGNIPPRREDVAFYGGIYEEELERYRSHGAWIKQMIRSKGIRRIRNKLQNDPSLDSYEMIVDTETGLIIARKSELY